MTPKNKTILEGNNQTLGEGGGVFSKMTKKIGHHLWMFPWPKSTLSTLLLSLPSALQTKWREN